MKRPVFLPFFFFSLRATQSATALLLHAECIALLSNVAETIVKYYNRLLRFRLCLYVNNRNLRCFHAVESRRVENDATQIKKDMKMREMKEQTCVMRRLEKGRAEARDTARKRIRERKRENERTR